MALLLAAFVALPYACGQNTPGTSNLTFLWPEGVKPDFAKVSLYASAKLQQWPGGDQAAASTLSESGPAKLGDTAQQLTFGDLTYGGERVVVVEIRGAERKDAAVLYFGASDLFAIEAGKTTDVAVKLALQPGPALEKPLVRIFFDGNEAEIVRSAKVTLRLTLSHADTVTVANDPAFFAGKAELPLSSLKAIGGNEYEWPGAWDINEGLEGTGDGQRSVFVKTSNAFGHVSEMVRAGVTLDITPPGIFAESVSLSIKPAAGCVLDQNNVTALTVGSTAVVSFTATEPLDGLPILISKGSILALSFNNPVQNGTSWQMSYTVTGSELGLTEGEYELYVFLRDLAGNENAPAPGVKLQTNLTFKVIASLPVLTIDQTKVTYFRSPWGNGAEEKLDLDDPNSFVIPAGPYYSLAPADPRQNTHVVPAGTFLLQDGTIPTLLRVWTSEEMKDDLGSLIPNADGSWPRKELRKQNSPVLYASAIDRSCSETGPKKIENAEWVATMSGKVPGSTFENPFDFIATGYFRQSLNQDSSTGQILSQDIVGISSLDSQAIKWSSKPGWQRFNENLDSPSGRYDFAMAYDSTRDKVVLFGGRDCDNISTNGISLVPSEDRGKRSAEVP
ncbi:MAG: hypothetical protein HY897_26355 [Deltaproteobacteria bacterium]|nr:hypothetical protein [Deltaproteobacteria bacterium]